MEKKSIRGIPNPGMGGDHGKAWGPAQLLGQARGTKEGTRQGPRTGLQGQPCFSWGGGGNQEFWGLSLRWANAGRWEAPRCTHTYPPTHSRMHHHLRLSRLLMKYMAAAPMYLAMAPSTVPKLPSLTM